VKEPYFIRVTKQTPTEFWVNNPTREQAAWAIANGATGCTTNPSYGQKMIDHPAEGPHARQLLDEALRASEDINEKAAIFQRKLVRPICEAFMPLFEKTNGQQGFVTIQGDPIHEDDPDVVIREALENRKVAPNASCKIPTTEAGLAAMEYLVTQDVAMTATEVFGIQQAVVLAETYLKASRRSGKSPRLFMAHIAGIYDDHLKNEVERLHIDISPDVLWQGGLAVARKLYRLMEERVHPATFMAGGARGLHHFTEMVGGRLCCTINWEGTADKLLEQDPPVVYRLFNPVPDRVIGELTEKLPDFRRGYEEEGLKVEEFYDFGPVCLFRDMFTASWQRVLGLIEAYSR
jgi:transaldolase